MRPDASLTAARVLVRSLWPGNVSSDPEVLATDWALLDRAAIVEPLPELDRLDPASPQRAPGVVAALWGSTVLASRAPVASLRLEEATASAPFQGRRIRFESRALALLLALAPAEAFALVRLADATAGTSHGLLGLRAGRAVWVLVPAAAARGAGRDRIAAAAGDTVLAPGAATVPANRCADPSDRESQVDRGAGTTAQEPEVGRDALA